MNNFNKLDQSYPPQCSEDSEQVKVGKLDTLEGIRKEMARLYRSARKTAGARPDASTAAKLGYLLCMIGRTLEGVELEKRILELEKRMKV